MHIVSLNKFSILGFHEFKFPLLSLAAISSIESCLNDTSLYSFYDCRGSDGYDKHMEDGILSDSSSLYKTISHLLIHDRGKELDAFLNPLGLSSDSFDIHIYTYNNGFIPRPLHFDSIRNSVKLFVFLSPQPKSFVCPYVIVPFSQFFNRIIYIFNKCYSIFACNHILHPYTASWASFLPKKYFYGNPGNAFLSLQKCVHGDYFTSFPNKNNTNSLILKKLLVVNFYPS